MLPPQEPDSLLEDTIPQVMEQHPSSGHESTTVPSSFAASGDAPADASPNFSPDGLTTSSTPAADLELIAHQKPPTDGSTAALRGGEGTTKEDGDASGTEDEVRVLAAAGLCHSLCVGFR